MDHSCYVCIYVLCISCFLVCSLQPCGHLPGKGWPLISFVCNVFLWFCHVPMWCPGPGVVLDCIGFGSLPAALLLLYGASLAIIHF